MARAFSKLLFPCGCLGGILQLFGGSTGLPVAPRPERAESPVWLIGGRFAAEVEGVEEVEEVRMSRAFSKPLFAGARLGGILQLLVDRLVCGLRRC